MCKKKCNLSVKEDKKNPVLKNFKMTKGQKIGCIASVATVSVIGIAAASVLIYRAVKSVKDVVGDNLYEEPEQDCLDIEE